MRQDYNHNKDQNTGNDKTAMLLLSAIVKVQQTRQSQQSPQPNNAIARECKTATQINTTYKDFRCEIYSTSTQRRKRERKERKRGKKRKSSEDKKFLPPSPKVIPGPLFLDDGMILVNFPEPRTM